MAQRLLHYLELRIEYALAQSRARVAPVGAALLALLAVGLAAGVALLLLSIGLALALDRLTAPGVGFAVLASAYGLAAGLLWARRARLEAALRPRLERLLARSWAEPADTAAAHTPAPPPSSLTRPSPAPDA